MNTKLMVVALGVLLLVISFWIKGEAFDIQLYATYYIIGWSSVFRLLGLLCCLTGGIYFLLDRKRLSRP